MDQMPSLAKDRSFLAGEVVSSLLERFALQVVSGIRAMPLSRRHERADAGLVNIWEEFKYQFQKEHSTYTDFCQGEVHTLCENTVVSLTLDLQQLPPHQNLWVKFGSGSLPS